MEGFVVGGSVGTRKVGNRSCKPSGVRFDVLVGCCSTSDRDQNLKFLIHIGDAGSNTRTVWCCQTSYLSGKLVIAEPAAMRLESTWVYWSAPILWRCSTSQ